MRTEGLADAGLPTFKDFFRLEKEQESLKHRFDTFQKEREHESVLIERHQEAHDLKMAEIRAELKELKGVVELMQLTATILHKILKWLGWITLTLVPSIIAVVHYFVK